MFRRTILPITSSEIIKTGLKGRIEAQTVNEEVNIFLEGQIDSGFISEITIGGNVYKGFLVKMDANPAPPPANRDPTTSSMIIPNMQPPKGIPGFDNLMYPSPLMSSAAFHPAPSFVPPPHPQTIALPPIDDESEKRDKKRKKEKRREKRDNSSSEEEKKDKKKKKKKKDTDNKRPDKSSSSSKSSKPANKPPSKPSVPQAPNYPPASSQLSFPPWFDVSQLSGNSGNSAAPLGWSGQSFATSLSTKCNSCQQILLYPSGEKTVRCPSCKAILDVENAESSVLRPCMGCGTMLGNPTNAIKVLCPLCKTTMDWSQAGKVTVQRENSGTKAVINLDEEESKPAPAKTEESPKEEEKKENGKEESKEDVMKVESTTTTSSPTTPPEEKSS